MSLIAGHPSAVGPQAIPHSAEVNQKRGQAVMLWAVGAFCIFGWEWILCIPQEYKRIWKKKFTPITVLYLANRYFGLIQFSFVISLVADTWGPAACRHVYYWEPVGALISTVLSQMILGVRVYALCSQNRIIGFLLSFTILVEICIGGFAISTTSPPSPVTGVGAGASPPCGAVMGPIGWLIAFWSMPLFYDGMTFLLTAWKAFDFWKKDVHTPLISVIWRDGVLYFFAIFSMNFTNVVIFLTTPTSLRAVNLTPTLILTVILSCRLVLNLRSTSTHTGFSAPSSGLTANNTKDRVNPSYKFDKPSPYLPKSEWMDLSATEYQYQAKLEPVRPEYFSSA